MDRKWWTLAAVSAGVFMLLLDVTIVNVALPDMESALDASLSDLQWVINAYALSLAALLLTAGSLADLLGRRRVFAIGVAIFTTGSLLCGLAPSPLFLTLARAGQGVGGAIMFATSLALLANAFHGKDRGIAFGVLRDLGRPLRAADLPHALPAERPRLLGRRDRCAAAGADRRDLRHRGR